MASDCIRIALLFDSMTASCVLRIFFFSGKWLLRMAAFQDYETATDGNGSVIIKLSSVSFFFFFCETETRVVVISSKALFEVWQLARQSPLLAD